MIAEKLLKGDPFRASSNDYDWLGPGIYFWETNPQRGLDWARELASRPKSKIKEPSVIGAVIDLGLCLDMMSQGAIELVRDAFDSLKQTLDVAAIPLPKNEGRSLILRRLDCAVIRRLHTLLSASKTELDTLRGVFVEGSPIYDGAGFDAKTHIQICVRNVECIKATFRVPADQLNTTVATATT